MSDVELKITRIYNDGKQEKVSDPIDRASIILKVCEDALLDMPFIEFMSWMGAIFDRYGMKNGYTPAQVENMVVALISSMIEIHKEDENKEDGL